jgi:cellulose synthase/poly-beta-1,6-N-acetylglucosamine synthase-like glycosyltransferase
VESLKSIIADTAAPYELVYVDAGSPKAVAAELAELCRANGFRYLRCEHFLTPNQSRNIGWAAASTPYVAFVDNDVIVSPGWLQALERCAEETDAEVVAPLTCQKLPLHTEIHQAGGRFTDDLSTFFTRPAAERFVDEEHVLQGRKVGEVELTRQETQCCEFHCALVRREVLERLGGLDEELLATKEHIDFCMSVWRHGGKVMFEPSSVVTYLFPNRARPLSREDWPFFTLRWSPQWQRLSLRHFQRKWGLAEDPYFDKRERMLGWRHREGIARPVARSLPLFGNWAPTQHFGMMVVVRMLKMWSRSLVNAHARQTMRRA